MAISDLKLLERIDAFLPLRAESGGQSVKQYTHQWKRGHNARFIHLFALFIAFTFFNPTHCYSDIYKVPDVQVDVKAESAVEAKKQAIRQAHLKAFEMLMERLVPEEERSSLNGLTPEQVQPFVDGYEVTDQKQSNVRYIATLTFYFRERPIKSYLSGHTVRAISSKRPPMVVLPVFIENDSMLLWEENPWLKAWMKREKLSEITPIVIPIGDLQDITTIDSAQIASSQTSALHTLARRYGAGGVILAFLKKKDADPLRPMEATVKIVDLDGQTFEITETPEVTSEGPQNQQFDQAIDLIVKKIEDSARNKALQQVSQDTHSIDENKDTNSEPERHIYAQVHFESPQIWLNIEQTLRSTDTIDQIIIKSLTRNKALVSLEFQGGVKVLASALGAQGLILEQLNGKTWIIKKAGPRPYTPSSY